MNNHHSINGFLYPCCPKSEIIILFYKVGPKKYLRYKWGYNLQPQAKPIYKAVYRDFIGGYTSTRKTTYLYEYEMGPCQL